MDEGAAAADGFGTGKDTGNMADDVGAAAGPRWVEVEPGFRRLMLGRIELAQLARGRATGDWFYDLRFCQGEELSSGPRPTEAEAAGVAALHAAKVLA